MALDHSSGSGTRSGTGISARIGLIGLGRHGSRYAKHLMQDVPGAHLAAVARRQVDRPLPFPPPSDLRVHDDGPSLIADPTIDAVIAVVPPAFNPSFCAAAVRAGKPLLMEKPFAADLPAAREMLAAVESARLPLMVAHTLRFDPTVAAFRARLPKLGSLSTLTLTFTVPSRPRPSGNPGFHGRGPLLDLGVHLFDLIRILTQDELRSVRSTIESRQSDGVDTAARVEGVTHGGCTCLLRVGWEGATHVGLGEAIGTQGRLQMDWNARLVTECLEQGSPESWTISPLQTIPVVIAAFLRALSEGTAMPITARDGFQAVRAVEAAYESATKGTLVEIHD